MAIGPLAIRAPQVSLIGGQQLAKASGEGVPVPRIEGAFDSMLNVFEQKNKENDNLSQKIRAQQDEEAYTGATPADAYTPLPQRTGNPVYDAARLDSRVSNSAARIEQNVNAQMASIYVRTDISLAEKIPLIQSVVAGATENLDPFYKQRAREVAQAAADRYTNTLVSQQATQDHDNLVKERAISIKTEMDAAIAASSSGNDDEAQRHTKEMLHAHDQLVGLGEMTEAEAQQRKDANTRLIVAASTQRRIVMAMTSGKISPQQGRAFSELLDAGGDGKLFTDETYKPNGFNDLHDLTDTQMPAKLVADTSDFRRAIQDPETLEKVAQEIRQLSEYMDTAGQKGEERRAFFNWLNSADETSRIDPGLEKVQNDVVEEMITRREHLTPEGMNFLEVQTLKTKRMQPFLLATMKDGIRGNDMKMVQAYAQLWQRLTESEMGSAQIGEDVRTTISAADQEYMDNAVAALKETAGLDDKEATRVFSLFMKKTQEPGNTLGRAIEQFNVAGQANKAIGRSAITYNSMNRDFFTANYSQSEMPASMQNEIDTAFFVSSQMTTGKSPQEILAAVHAKILNRFKPARIYSQGFGPDMSNPTGYIDYINWSGTNAPYDDLWVNDFMKDVLGDNMPNLVFEDPNDKEFLQHLLAPGGDPRPLGNGLTLEPVGTGEPDQYQVVMHDADGNPIVLVVKDGGRRVPLLVDPGIVRQHINARADANQKVKQLEDAHGSKLDRMISRQYAIKFSESSMKQRSLMPKYPPLRVDEEAFEKFIQGEPDQWVKEYQKTAKDQATALQEYTDRLNAEVPELQPGNTYDPETLLQPRAYGTSVTLGAVKEIERLFPDGQGGQALLNVALAETGGGTNPEMFRVDGDTGIWQINNTVSGAFLEVQRLARQKGSTIAIANEKLKTIGVDLTTITARDLDKPLVSAAVARMYFMRNPVPFPSDPAAQAAHWKKYYNPGATESMLSHFVDSANSVLVSDANAATPRGAGTTTTLAYASEGGPPGAIIDSSTGKANPRQFTEMVPAAQSAAIQLSSAFGKELRITPHGGRSGRASGGSQHPLGTAMDVYVADYTPEEKTRLIATAIAMGYTGIGGYGPGSPSGHGTLHFDIRKNPATYAGLSIWWWNSRGGKKGTNWKAGDDWFLAGIDQGLRMRSTNG
jgi:hypothetical protein